MRSQQDKWRVPDEDPAGKAADDSDGVRMRPLEPDAVPASDAEPGARSSLIYCGLCGGLNPSTSHYCAACGATLVDAFHASEGLRVYAQPDTASRIIDIVAAGTALDIVDDPDAPEDFVRVKLEFGRLGYIRVADIDALAGTSGRPVTATLSEPNINTAARGCITQTSALSALVLMVALAALVGLYVQQSDSAESGIVALAACSVIGPLLFVTIGLYVFARSRDDRREMELLEATERERPASDGGA